MDVVVVESPAKAKTINKYLGGNFTVLASYGHIRDLPSKEGSVRPDENFAMVWDVDSRGQKRVKEIADAVRGADRLILATDPDREGEAISWHVLEVLRNQRVLGDVDIKRVVFHEITRDAVQEALAQPRDVDKDLVEAYLARRALDYLVGFTLSPVLWRKVPGSRSAGRVQSVALRLICEREAEIEAFRPDEYWTIEADFLTPRREPFSARLTHLDGKKLEKLSLGDKAAADKAVAAIENGDFRVLSVERKEVKRNPAPPFTTSTLQQEASRKLGFGASRTMRLAQQLYEGVNIDGETMGLITYMRTDSVTLSNEAIQGCRRLIERDFGESYLPDSPRVYKTKSKNAQEAHEAIRPTDLFRRPPAMRKHLDGDQAKLYELIWKRTVACEMSSAILDRVTVDLADGGRDTVMRATGQVIRFDGFIRVYREGYDEPSDEDDENRLLPDMAQDEIVERTDVRPDQHFTAPPPRYTEASLVKKLEELGIGRPSTYASILQVLQDRDYVRLDRKRFVPEDRGRVVTSFLTNFFQRYVEYDFTANLENLLDRISNGEVDWKDVLREFWGPFKKAVDDARGLTNTEVIDVLDEALGSHFFPETEDGQNPRKCPQCENGRLGLKVGKFGGFIGCSNYPECRFTRQLAIANGNDAVQGAIAQGESRLLGNHPDSGLPVYLKGGPYGPYVQHGEDPQKGEDKPQRVSLPRGVEPGGIDLDYAVRLLTLPREVGMHPESGEPITAGLGRYGPFVRHKGTYKSLDSLEDAFTIGLNHAVSLLQEASKKSGELRALGEHPEDGKPISVMNGRYGPYVKHGKTNATLPKDKPPEDITLEEAVELIAKKAQKGNSGGGKGGRRGKKAAASSK